MIIDFRRGGGEKDFAIRISLRLRERKKYVKDGVKCSVRKENPSLELSSRRNTKLGFSETREEKNASSGGVRMPKLESTIRHGIPADQMGGKGDLDLSEFIGKRIVVIKRSQPIIQLPVTPAEASQGYRSNRKETGIHIPTRSAGSTTPTSA